jgi:hypothetical protein
MEEQTKIEKNKATKYMPMQKNREFKPPMAERVDFGFMDISLVFSRVLLRFFPYWETTRTGDCKD